LLELEQQHIAIAGSIAVGRDVARDLACDEPGGQPVRFLIG
jgi:hypothetical protein